MERVAVIDIGTVTARLAIADVDGEHVARLLKQSTICNLGEGLTQTGRISDVAAERVLSCVDAYLACAREAGAPVACCTLTSAARDAGNSGALLARLVQRGLDAQVIAGSLEGSLTFLGVARDFIGRRILVADSGGGSTELAAGTLSGAGLALDAVCSVDVGCRRVTERFLSRNDPPLPQDVDAARSFVAELFSDALAKGSVLTSAPERLVVTGGTVTSLVAIDEELEPYDSRRVHLSDLSRATVEGMAHRLATLTVAERSRLAGLQPQRASVILGGAVVVAELMAQASFDVLTVSESDLLFGLSLCVAAAVRGGGCPLPWRPRLSSLR
ncbi:phosphatase [Olsenella uli]|uniref:Ppx/GppA phosphatase family protein n=1 Tax=Olsenella uli TaxID=133926 RepID=UPI00325FBEB8